MTDLIKLKRSATPAKAPGTVDLELGELAINTYDGKVYLKKNDGTDAIVEVTGLSGQTITESQISDLQNYLTSETSHADVLVDGDFATAGLMKTDGAGTYSIDANTYSSSTHNHELADIAIQGAGSPTELTNGLQAFTMMWSSGIWSGAEITDNLDGTIDLSAGEGSLRSSASGFAPIYAVAIPAQAGISLTDKSVNYIYGDYNGGNPQYGIGTSLVDFNCLDKCLVWRVVRDGTDLYWLDGRGMNVDSNRNHRRMLFDTEGFRFSKPGSILGSPSGLYVSVSAGSTWFGLNKITYGAISTDGLDRFSYFYQDGIGGWTEQTNQATVNVTNYDDGDGTLGALTNNHYGVTWFYLVFTQDGGSLYAVYGTGDYNKEAEAQAATPPSTLPALIANQGALIGRTIYLKSATTVTMESTLGVTFGTSGVSTHNNLSDLQGGAAGEYYHLTAAQASANALTTDITYETLNTNGDVGTTAGTLAIGNHDHDSAYLGLTATATSTNALQSATTTIDVAAATAPTVGQVLTAVNGTSATWQTSVAGGITIQEEGINVLTGVATIDFVGDGVTATATGGSPANNDVTVTIDIASIALKMAIVFGS